MTLEQYMKQRLLIESVHDPEITDYDRLVLRIALQDAALRTLLPSNEDE